MLRRPGFAATAWHPLRRRRACTFDGGYMYPGDTSGHGVAIDEDPAARYPLYACLPVPRLADGTLWNW
ncbi:MAG TPA: hypothetical protein VK943_15955 [Arenibaculum sp.]|nr:hypothetical protein [Arenibaculum sp.]